jgi:hypothetical protein
MIHYLSIIRHPIRRLLIAAVAALCFAGRAPAQGALAANSPFAPKGSAGAGVNAPAEAYELAGSSVEGTDVSVCIFERQAKRTRWIPVGTDADGVKVISYDPVNDTAVVMVSGERRELSMRKAVVVAQGPAPATRPAPPIGRPAPAAPIAAARQEPAVAPGSPAQEQREARMLVSDLLEIGIQQRKAYQEAKQKAASGTPPPSDN